MFFSKTQDSPYVLDPEQPETIKKAKFVQGVPLKVIIHGYTGNKDYSPNMELRPGEKSFSFEPIQEIYRFVHFSTVLNRATVGLNQPLNINIFCQQVPNVLIFSYLLATFLTLQG